MNYNLLEELYHGGVLKDYKVYTRLKEIKDPVGGHFLTDVQPTISLASQIKRAKFLKKFSELLVVVDITCYNKKGRLSQRDYFYILCA